MSLLGKLNILIQDTLKQAGLSLFSVELALISFALVVPKHKLGIEQWLSNTVHQT